MAALYDIVFKDLIIDTFDAQQACRTGHKFFGKNNVNFVAIGGTEYSKPMFDMVVFYAGAYSCEGNITFSQEEKQKDLGENISIVYKGFNSFGLAGSSTFYALTELSCW